MKLFLFTNFFPCKRSEPFLVTEFEFTKKYFESISILPLYGKPEDSILKAEQRTELLEPVFKAAGNPKQIFLKGLFNLAPFHFHLKEFFQKRLFLSPKKSYWFFISVLITRAVLSSRSYKALVKELKANPQSVLYFYWGDNLCWIIPYLVQKAGADAKITLRLHGSDLYENLKADYAPLRSLIFSRASLVVTVAENGRNYLASKYPEYAGKMKVARLGVLDHGLNPDNASEQFNLISVSNIVPVKRVKMIFEALQKCNLKIKWEHFGDGPLLEELQILLKNKRNDLEVILHGHVSNAQLMDYYRNSHVDCLINASYSEGLPVSIMEALSFGVPVIATNVGGTSELVDQEVGALIDRDGGAEKLAEAISKLASKSKEEMSGLRVNARRKFESTVNAEKNYSAFYQQIIS